MREGRLPAAAGGTFVIPPLQVTDDTTLPVERKEKLSETQAMEIDGRYTYRYFFIM